MAWQLLLTCEHATHEVPPSLRRSFAGAGTTLASHRGWDPGAKELAQLMASRLKAELHAGSVSRLVIELNRSLQHPRLFSEFTRPLAQADRQLLVEQYYAPYRQKVEASIARLTHRGPVAHVSVHSFTPVLAGEVRKADVALLYDPARRAESRFASRWLAELRAARPDLRLRRNYPYQGKSDGLTKSLREQFGDRRYVGIELEVNQRYPQGDRAIWRALQQSIVDSLALALAAR